MTLEELVEAGYRMRYGGGSWTLFHGEDWGSSRVVARGKLSYAIHAEIDSRAPCADKAAMKEIIGKATADFVHRRIKHSE